MAFDIKQFSDFVKEDSHHVDGTHISKNSEKILNVTATVVYYLFLVAAISWLCAGVFGFIYSIYEAILHAGKYSGEIIMLGILALIFAIVAAILFYLAGVVSYSYLRTLTNISLSLKMLNYKQAPMQQYNEQLYQNQPQYQQELNTQQPLADSASYLEEKENNDDDNKGNNN